VDDAGKLDEVELDEVEAEADGLELVVAVAGVVDVVPGIV
jgi:hypothetical protein